MINSAKANGFILGAIPPKDALGLTDEAVEGMYSQAYRLYNTGKYSEAAQMFRLLVMLNPAQPKFTFGLGACMHLLKEYRNAIELYTMSASLDKTSPLALYHLSDCYLQIKDKLAAVVALEMVIKRAGDNSAHRVLKDRAKMTLENLKTELQDAGVLNKS